MAVSPDGKWAFLAHWGSANCTTNPGTGGAWVVDISDLSNPRQVGFISASQESRPGEGMQVVPIKTK